jgi:hypothetical protein
MTKEMHGSTDGRKAGLRPAARSSPGLKPGGSARPLLLKWLLSPRPIPSGLMFRRTAGGADYWRIGSHLAATKPDVGGCGPGPSGSTNDQGHSLSCRLSRHSAGEEAVALKQLRDVDLMLASSGVFECAGYAAVIRGKVVFASG